MSEIEEQKILQQEMDSIKPKTIDNLTNENTQSPKIEIAQETQQQLIDGTLETIGQLSGSEAKYAEKQTSDVIPVTDEIPVTNEAVSELKQGEVIKDISTTATIPAPPAEIVEQDTMDAKPEQIESLIIEGVQASENPAKVKQSEVEELEKVITQTPQNQQVKEGPEVVVETPESKSIVDKEVTKSEKPQSTDAEDTIAISDTTSKLLQREAEQQPTMIALDTLTHTIDKFLSDEIASVVKKLSETSNNTELSKSLQLAQELQNSLDTSQIKPGNNQAQLVQDLNSSLLTLQLVALESVEQPDPIVSKEAIHKILDVAESFASQLDAFLSSSMHQDDDANAQALNKYETTETVTSQILLNQSNTDANTFINNSTDNVPASVEQTSDIHDVEINTATASCSEILETLLIESAKTIMIPVVGDVLNEDLPTTLKLLVSDMSAVHPEVDNDPLEGSMKGSPEEMQMLQIKEDTHLIINSESIEQANEKLKADDVECTEPIKTSSFEILTSLKDEIVFDIKNEKSDSNLGHINVEKQLYTQIFEVTAEKSTTDDVKVLDPVRGSGTNTDAFAFKSESRQEQELNLTDEEKVIQTIIEDSRTIIQESNDNESERVCNESQIIQGVNDTPSESLERTLEDVTSKQQTQGIIDDNIQISPESTQNVEKFESLSEPIKVEEGIDDKKQDMNINIIETITLTDTYSLDEPTIIQHLASNELENPVAAVQSESKVVEKTIPTQEIEPEVSKNMIDETYSIIAEPSNLVFNEAREFFDPLILESVTFEEIGPKDAAIQKLDAESMVQCEETVSIKSEIINENSGIGNTAKELSQNSPTMILRSLSSVDEIKPTFADQKTEIPEKNIAILETELIPLEQAGIIDTQATILTEDSHRPDTVIPCESCEIMVEESIKPLETHSDKSNGVTAGNDALSFEVNNSINQDSPPMILGSLTPIEEIKLILADELIDTPDKILAVLENEPIVLEQAGRTDIKALISTEDHQRPKTIVPCESCEIMIEESMKPIEIDFNTFDTVTANQDDISEVKSSFGESDMIIAVNQDPPPMTLVSLTPIEEVKPFVADQLTETSEKVVAVLENEPIVLEQVVAYETQATILTEDCDRPDTVVPCESCETMIEESVKPIDIDSNTFDTVTANQDDISEVKSSFSESDMIIAVNQDPLPMALVSLTPIEEVKPFVADQLTETSEKVVAVFENEPIVLEQAEPNETKVTVIIEDYHIPETVALCECYEMVIEESAKPMIIDEGRINKATASHDKDGQIHKTIALDETLQPMIFDSVSKMKEEISNVEIARDKSDRTTDTDLKTIDNVKEPISVQVTSESFILDSVMPLEEISQLCASTSDEPILEIQLINTNISPTIMESVTPVQEINFEYAIPIVENELEAVNAPEKKEIVASETACFDNAVTETSVERNFKVLNAYTQNAQPFVLESMSPIEISNMVVCQSEKSQDQIDEIPLNIIETTSPIILEMIVPISNIEPLVATLQQPSDDVVEKNVPTQTEMIILEQVQTNETVADKRVEQPFENIAITENELQILEEAAPILVSVSEEVLNVSSYEETSDEINKKSLLNTQALILESSTPTIEKEIVLCAIQSTENSEKFVACQQSESICLESVGFDKPNNSATGQISIASETIGRNEDTDSMILENIIPQNKQESADAAELETNEKTLFSHEGALMLLEQIDEIIEDAIKHIEYEKYIVTEDTLGPKEQICIQPMLMESYCEEKDKNINMSIIDQPNDKSTFSEVMQSIENTTDQKILADESLLRQNVQTDAAVSLVSALSDIFSVDQETISEILNINEADVLSSATDVFDSAISIDDFHERSSLMNPIISSSELSVCTEVSHPLIFEPLTPIADEFSPQIHIETGKSNQIPVVKDEEKSLMGMTVSDTSHSLILESVSSIDQRNKEDRPSLKATDILTEIHTPTQEMCIVFEKEATFKTMPDSRQIESYADVELTESVPVNPLIKEDNLVQDSKLIVANVNANLQSPGILEKDKNLRDTAMHSFVENTEKTALVQHINDFISEETSDLVYAISTMTNSQELKESIELAKSLKESIEIIEVSEEPGLVEDAKIEQAKLVQKLQDTLVTLHNKALESAEDIGSMSKPDALQKVSEVITHLQEDLEKAIVILPEVLQTAEIVEVPDEQNSMKQLEVLLQEVTDKINIPTVREVEDTEALQNALDEVQTVIIKLKCDYDGAANDTLNETLEDLECSVRSVQLQINEDSPPELLKDACATLQLLVNNMSETQEVQAAETVSVEVKNENILEKCSSESNETVELLEQACKVDIKNENLAGIVSSLNILKDTIKTLKLSFGSNAEVLIEKGVDVIQTLDQLEDKVFSLEKELAEVNLSTETRDHILTAVHSVYGSISNMRGTMSSIQKRYMFENYGKPSETLLKSIKNISVILDIEKGDQNNWKSFTKSLRKVLNHFEDIKFYINLDKTARLPSDAAFTKIILEELKSNICEVLVPKASILDKETVNKVIDLIECVNKCLTNMESKSTLEVKEKIPIFKQISSEILKVTELIKMKITDISKQSTAIKQEPEALQQQDISLEKVHQVQEVKNVTTEGKSDVKFDDTSISQTNEPMEKSHEEQDTVSQTVVEETSAKKTKVRKTVMIQEIDINEIQQVATELVDEIAAQAIIAIQNLEALSMLGKETVLPETEVQDVEDEIIQNPESSEMNVEESIAMEESTLATVGADETIAEIDLQIYHTESTEVQEVDKPCITQGEQTEVEAAVSTSDVKTDMEQEATPQKISEEELSGNKSQKYVEDKQEPLSSEKVQVIKESEQDLSKEIQKEEDELSTKDRDMEKLLEEVQGPSTSGTQSSKVSATTEEESKKDKEEIVTSQEKVIQDQTETRIQSIESVTEIKDTDIPKDAPGQVEIEKEQVSQVVKEATEKEEIEPESNQEVSETKTEQEIETSETGIESKHKEATKADKVREDEVSEKNTQDTLDAETTEPNKNDMEQAETVVKENVEEETNVDAEPKQRVNEEKLRSEIEQKETKKVDQVELEAEQKEKVDIEIKHDNKEKRLEEVQTEVSIEKEEAEKLDFTEAQKEPLKPSDSSESTEQKSAKLSVEQLLEEEVKGEVETEVTLTTDIKEEKKQEVEKEKVTMESEKGEKEKIEMVENASKDTEKKVKSDTQKDEEKLILEVAEKQTDVKKQEITEECHAFKVDKIEEDDKAKTDAENKQKDVDDKLKLEKERKEVNKQHEEEEETQFEEVTSKLEEEDQSEKLETEKKLIDDETDEKNMLDAEKKQKKAGKEKTETKRIEEEDSIKLKEQNKQEKETKTKEEEEKLKLESEKQEQEKIAAKLETEKKRKNEEKLEEQKKQEDETQKVEAEKEQTDKEQTAKFEEEDKQVEADKRQEKHEEKLEAEGQKDEGELQSKKNWK
ncbi:unnamed protein product [Spodoptera littoralis]|uniref:Uncharacterized protein n=1 Tax=Spodoptera littoralis TaxID=7109 RepID=A0A9P0N9L1_SPOLI|nr:unnamed protein product [Spodoptera littoralis]CAH1647411.1 unnamed protein product [Spodoptera littoralis]